MKKKKFTDICRFTFIGFSEEALKSLIDDSGYELVPRKDRNLQTNIDLILIDMREKKVALVNITDDKALLTDIVALNKYYIDEKFIDIITVH